MIRRLLSIIRTQMRYLVCALPGSPLRRVRNSLWRCVGFDVHSTANLMPSATLVCGRIHIGKETFIGDDVLITGGDIHIGDNCDIAPRAILHAGSHAIGDSNRRAGNAYYGTIAVGDGSWICTGAIILDGARIGRGVIVAAGSVVQKGAYPDNCLLAGVPARVKKVYSGEAEVTIVNRASQ